MRVGVPRETRSYEYRVGLTPTSVRELTHHGHEAIVQSGAGRMIDLDDAAYRAAGARVVETADEVFEAAELVVKVKSPTEPECRLLREDQVLFTYLHLAADEETTRRLLERGTVCIAYETVTDARGGLPLLAPMSEVAGRMAIQAGTHSLEMEQGGRGVLLGGVPGVPPGRVVILGAGVVGTNAARMAIGLEAEVTILDIDLDRLAALDMRYGNRLGTIFSTRDSIEAHVARADLVIGAVLVPGAAAPKLVTDAMVREMRAGSVIVDVAIDQGGSVETSRPTTHAAPTFVAHDVVHYCVTNMPGAVARTSAFALNNATLPFVAALADKGWRRALADDPHLRAGLNVAGGVIYYEAIAEAFGMAWSAPGELLGTAG